MSFDWRALVANLRRWFESHSQRDRRIIAGVAAAMGLALAYIALIEPIFDYRRAVAEEMVEGQERLEQAERFVGALDSLRTERDDLRQKLDQARTRLLPGGSGALGAAALQERVNAVAAARGITVQSTQVMREEEIDPFRKVSVRLTLQVELRPFAGFLADLEHGPQQLRVPMIELSRRAIAAGARTARTIAATVEVSGYVLARGEPEATAPAEGGDAEGEAPAPEGDAPPAAPPAAAPAPAEKS